MNLVTNIDKFHWTDTVNEAYDDVQDYARQQGFAVIKRHSNQRACTFECCHTGSKQNYNNKNDATKKADIVHRTYQDKNGLTKKFSKSHIKKEYLYMENYYLVYKGQPPQVEIYNKAA
ncbi:hypothetical protein BDC45DRAFT_542819 [Circinella umbellata]|nr:hypothetical protein BDC45DRAFT_542819 [Circinella umbellata]